MIVLQRTASLFVAPLVLLIGSLPSVCAGDAPRVFQAGASAVDITPTRFPVIVNGYFQERTANRAYDRLMSRALVLDDGQTRLAIVVVDSLMIPDNLLDEAKRMASEATGIPTDRMLISATHTHTAPSAMGCLGSRADPHYVQFLPVQIAKSIQQAAGNLGPARIGWSVVQDAQHNHCRRWIFRPDRMGTDPFGVRNVRAHMHPGHQSPNHVGPSGPADTDFSLIAVQTLQGEALAVLANYAMHYYGATPVSGDCCGRFGNAFEALLRRDAKDQGTNTQDSPPFVGILSQGTSGDSMWMDYSRPAPKRDLDAYTAALAKTAFDAYQSVKYHDWVPLSMAETTLRLRRRVPDAERLNWARSVLKNLGDRLPSSQAEIYAREQVYLHEEPEVELKLQAIRIGDLGITAIPNEVYGLTGLKLKAQSPLQPTFNIELANGAFGYIPPPEQHVLGGYTTWPARTAGLEVAAEPRIVETLLGLLEKVAGKPRRPLSTPPTPYSKQVAQSQPLAYWSLNEMTGRQAHDSTGNHHATFEDGVVFYLPGPSGKGLNGGERGNRAPHCAGGRITARVPELEDTYSVELWFWNGLPADARPVTGYFFSRGPAGDADAPGDHLGIGGTHQDSRFAGKLIFFNGNEKNQVLCGRTTIPLKKWQHVVLVRDGTRVTVYLNGNRRPEIDGEAAVSRPRDTVALFFGGRNDRFALWEGRLDEVSVYGRALTAEEASAHYEAAVHAKVRDLPPPPSAAQRPKPAANGSTAQPDPPPLSPAQSLAAIHVREGFAVELVAAEPLVKDPVAIAWDERGRLWVAEMADYPLGTDGKGKPGGRIRVLEDTDRDGRYDRSTVFLDNVNFPTSVLPYRDSVIVTAAPEIFLARDTDGDGHADRRETLFSGFQEGNQQLRVNGLRWGLDNWIYCASGSHRPNYGASSRIRSAKQNKLIALGSRDFRFRPDTGELEPQSGPSQFGRNRDDWGNWFGEQNSFPLWHYILDDHYLRRNPHFAPPDPRKQLVVPRNPRVYPAKSPQKRFHSFEQSGRFTSACSAMIYRDHLLFDDQEQHAHAFTCEPFHNLVQHNVLEEDGVSFAAHRDPADGTIDFFASRDRWCRPVMVRTGPDGALWVVDMYRYMIEHPQWLTPAGREELRPFYRSGDERGRIYRIYPKGKRPRPIRDLAQLKTTQLVKALDSPNGPQRDLAQRLLIERHDTTSIPLLQRMALKSPNPLARLHALCTLDGLTALSTEVVRQALHDDHAGVRRHAIRLAEARGARDPKIVADAVELVNDPNAKVRLQLAYSLGEWPGKTAARALARLAIQSDEDRYLVAAVSSSISEHNLPDVLAAVLEHQDHPAAGRWVGRLLAMAVAFGDTTAVRSGLTAVLQPADDSHLAWQFETVAGLLDALRQHRVTLEAVIKADSEQGAALRKQVRQLASRARAVAAAEESPSEVRQAAIRLLARDAEHRASDFTILAELLKPQIPADIRQAAVQHLAAQQEAEVANLLLSEWPSYSPALRSEVLMTMTTRPQWLTVLLRAIEEKRVAIADLDARTRQLLLVHPDQTIRSRATALLADSVSEDRKAVIAAYLKALDLPGSPERGKVVFQRVCAACHRWDGVGHDIGPNLHSLSDRRPATLLVSLLDPSASVDGKYVSYVVLTDDGRTFSGILASETANSITLVEQDDKRHVILRRHIEAIRSTGKSLMPDGLEKDLSPQDVADLMSLIGREER